jgi:hypothetical protein
MDNKEPDDKGDKVIIKYSSYTPAQKRATQKYRQNNKEKVNEQRKKYYQLRKEKDPEFLEYKRLKAKEYYQKRKELKVDGLEIPVLERADTEPKLIEEPILPEIVEELIQPKKKRSSRKKVEPEVEVIPEPEPIVEVIPEPVLEVIPEKKTKRTKKAKKSKEV